MPPFIVPTLNNMHLPTETVDTVAVEHADEGAQVFTIFDRELLSIYLDRVDDRARRQPNRYQLCVGSVRSLVKADEVLAVGDMNLHGQVLTERVTEPPGCTGRVDIVVYKVNLADRLIIRVERGVDEALVHRLLFDIYPEVEENYRVGNVFLKIETGADLSHQIKGMRIRDRRTGDQIT